METAYPCSSVGQVTTFLLTKKNKFGIFAAGTGKSFLIKAIQLATTNLYGQRACLLAAPTGLAALAIGGLTLHTALSLEVQKGSESAMRELTPNKLQQLRVLYEHCRVLIVDEISMVSNLTLVKMHRRLAMIRGDTSEFMALRIFSQSVTFQNDSAVYWCSPWETSSSSLPFVLLPSSSTSPDLS